MIHSTRIPSNTVDFYILLWTGLVCVKRDPTTYTHDVVNPAHQHTHKIQFLLLAFVLITIFILFNLFLKSLTTTPILMCVFKAELATSDW